MKMRILSLFFTVLILSLASSTALARVCYVDLSATGLDTGASWADAYPDLQLALSDSTLVTGDEIWVAAGTYAPTDKSDRTIFFEIPEGIAVYGGFVGTEILRTERDWESNATILSGNNGLINAYHVVVGSNNTLLDGFTISNGIANGDSGQSYNCGGGLYLVNCDMTISNCTFLSNQSSGNGGSVYINYYCDITFSNCFFKSNTSPNGGAIYANNHANYRLENCYLSDNSANLYGGAVYNNYELSATFVNCVFDSNTANYGGAAYAQTTIDLVAINCTFYGNNSVNIGAGSAFNCLSHVNLKLTNCLFDNLGTRDIYFNNYCNLESIHTLILGGLPGTRTYINSSNNSYITLNTGTLNATPLFIDAVNDDFRLEYNSPGIDAGHADNAPAQDIAGQSRVDNLLIYNTGGSTPDYVDIGAFEEQGNVPVGIYGKITGDVVDGVDITITGPTTMTVSTDSYGNYISAILADGTYTVRPSQSQAVINPSETTVIIAGAPVFEIDFESTALIISGQISGDRRSGVTLSLTGSGTYVTTSSATGAFDIQVEPGTYTLTPNFPLTIFSPDHIQITVTTTNIIDLNFTSTSLSVIYIDVSATGTGNGNDWANAYTDFDTIEFVTGVTAHIAEGTYCPTTGTNRYATIALAENVSLLGGYPSGGGVRDPSAHPTILSGDLLGNDGDNFTNYSDNSLKVVTADQNVLIDGLIIEHGNASIWSSYARGAGLFVPSDVSILIINDCIFRGHRSYSNGAALYSTNTSGTITITGSRFELNRSSTGQSGGGFYGTVQIYGSAAISDCVFEGNTGCSGIFLAGGSVVNCDFLRNTESRYQGGSGISATLLTTLEVTDCRFSDNIAPQYGGALYIQSFNGSSLNMRRCIIEGNRATNGGGLYIQTVGIVQNCLLINNIGTSIGGAIYCSGGCAIQNCTVMGNTAASNGGGIYLAHASAAVQNSIVWNNQASAGSNIGLSSGSISYCIVPEIPGGGNINEDPRMIGGGNYRLSMASPAINAASALYAPSDDFDGQFRDSLPDIGCYEFNAGETTYFITGNITGEWIRGVTLSMTGTATGTFTTGDDGGYIFTGLSDGNYTIEPLFPGLSFSPVNETIVINGVGAAGVDFSSLSETYTIYGVVTGTDGVSISVTGVHSYPVQTNPDGSFAVDVLPGVNTLRPVKPGWSFYPAYETVTILNTNVSGVAFAAIPNNGHVISGYVSGVVVEGVEIAIQGDDHRTTTTNATGFYEFRNLGPGSYTVSPSTGGLVFTPSDYTIELGGSSRSDIDFVSAPGDVIYVDVNASGANNGTSWTDAYTDLQDALAGADPVDIFIAQGTYHPSSSGDRTASFVIRYGMRLYGGYHASTHIRDTELYPTILSGDLSNNDTSNYGNYSENSYRVLIPASDILIDGLVISGGNANISSYQNGAGVYFSSACTGVVFNNCEISDNSSYYEGGALDGYLASEFSLINCRILRNRSYTGVYGGGADGAVSASNCTATIINCDFISNIGVGALEIGDGSISGCLFQYNVTTRLTNSVGVSVIGEASIDNCVFDGNTGTNVTGIAIYVNSYDGCQAVITNSIFINNSGGSATVYLTNESSMTNCLVVNNTVSSSCGGVLFSEYSSLNGYLTNCTIAGNTVTSGNGGGVSCTGGLLHLLNTLVYGNTAATNPNIFVSSGTLDVKYCDIEGGYTGIGNINSNPLFVSSADYRLQTGSPCIDAGLFAGAPQLDLDGDPRSSIPDIGCYETFAIPLHSISGTVSGDWITGTMIEYAGTSSGAVSVNDVGEYMIPNALNGNYFLTPLNEGVIFSPATRSVTVSDGDIAGINFTSSATLYTISGQVSGPTNVTMLLTGPAFNLETQTDASGLYSFEVPASAYDYVIVPILSGYEFSPANQSVTVTAANVIDVDFSGSVENHTISGTISGVGRSGATITARDGASTYTAISTSTGAYSISAPGLTTYTVSVSLIGYIYTPSQQTVALDIVTISGINFTSELAEWTIDGTMSGAVSDGVTLTLSGDGNQTVISGAGGAFIFNVNNGVYTITPSLYGYDFTPPSRTLTISNANQTADFTAVAQTPKTLSGQISGDMIEGVTINLTGDQTQQILSATDGSYSFDVYDGNFTIVAERTGLNIAPATHAITVDGASIDSLDFSTSFLRIFSISGTVEGHPMAGTIIRLTGSETMDIEPAFDGSFSFNNMHIGDYTVQIIAKGYEFNPNPQSVSITGSTTTFTLSPITGSRMYDPQGIYSSTDCSLIATRNTTEPLLLILILIAGLMVRLMQTSRQVLTCRPRSRRSILSLASGWVALVLLISSGMLSAETKAPSDQLATLTIEYTKIDVYALEGIGNKFYIIVKNDGTAPLNWEIAESPDWLQIPKKTGWLNMNDREHIECFINWKKEPANGSGKVVLIAPAANDNLSYVRIDLTILKDAEFKAAYTQKVGPDAVPMLAAQTNIEPDTTQQQPPSQKVETSTDVKPNVVKPADPTTTVNTPSKTEMKTTTITTTTSAPKTTSEPKALVRYSNNLFTLEYDMQQEIKAEAEAEQRKFDRELNEQYDNPLEKKYPNFGLRFGVLVPGSASETQYSPTMSIGLHYRGLLPLNLGYQFGLDYTQSSTTESDIDGDLDIIIGRASAQYYFDKRMTIYSSLGFRVANETATFSIYDDVDLDGTNVSFDIGVGYLFRRRTIDISAYYNYIPGATNIYSVFGLEIEYLFF